MARLGTPCSGKRKESSEPASQERKKQQKMGISQFLVKKEVEKTGKPEPAAERGPLIYYGTRTHKQLSQVVGELGRLNPGHVRHTILGSRDHACVHEQVRAAPDRHAACKELVADNKCLYYKQFKTRYDRKPSLLRRHPDLPTIWDIEDLTIAGASKESRGQNGFCPYFAATRLLASDANLFLCPYNYLIDPRLRKRMDLNLKGAVVILDEAHNIEDVCRDAASFKLTEPILADAIRGIEILSDSVFIKTNSAKLQALNIVRKTFDDILLFLQRPRGRLHVGAKPGKDQHGKDTLTFDSTSTRDIFSDHFHLAKDSPFASAAVEIGPLFTRGDEGPDDAAGAVLLAMKEVAAAAAALEELQLAHHYMHLKENSYQDYCMHIYEEPGAGSPGKGSRKGRLSVSSQATQRPARPHFALSLWCFNPALAFGESFGSCRSVVVASGTMSPFGTFTGELGFDFPVRFEGKHVVKPSQFLAYSLARGPTGRNLRSVYATLQEDSYLVELGRVVTEVCRRVPHGVLVFFPSYSVMRRVREAWESSGLEEELSREKEVLWEPQNGSVNGVIESYRRRIESAKSGSGAGQSGAVLIAVCRGKVSEGVDFPDEMARAVVAFGIPYPAFKDPQVERKQAWNETVRKAAELGGKPSPLLAGRDWYEAQAYRALNQVLGRCIRHRNDWGAIILPDLRFHSSFSIRGVDPSLDGTVGAPKLPRNNISRWLRANLEDSDGFGPFLQRLEDFVHDHTHTAESEEDDAATLPAPLPAPPQLEEVAESEHSIFKSL